MAGTRRVRAASLLLASIAAALVVLAPGVALAVREPNPYGTISGCGPCHSDPSINGQRTDCSKCHTQPPDSDADGNPEFPWTGPSASVGPHGSYSTASDRCSMCHTLHAAPTAFRLLPGTTIKNTCLFCHDGTGGMGVYGAIKARTGAEGSGGHSVDTTNVVPGGASDGGTSTAAFGGVGGTLSCDDCHSTHDANTVNPFMGERLRIYSTGFGTNGIPYTNKLLKKRPTGATVETADYGSDWCMGCHKGRSSGGSPHNHPVESSLTQASPYTYERLPMNFVDSSYASRTNTYRFTDTPIKADWVRLGNLGNIYINSEIDHGVPGPPADNWTTWPPALTDYFPQFAADSGYLWVYPRATLQAGHAPICQQCHEDTRKVGYLSADGTQAWMQGMHLENYQADGNNPVTSDPPGNPRFQNFPHETENARMLVETDDDLCMNCHPPGVLP